MKLKILDNNGDEKTINVECISAFSKLYKYLHFAEKKQYLLILDQDVEQVYFPIVINEINGTIDCILYHYLVKDFFLVNNWLITVNNHSFNVYDINTWQQQPAILRNDFIEIFTANNCIVARTVDNKITVYQLPMLNLITTIELSIAAKISIINDCIVERLHDIVHLYNTRGQHVAVWDHPNIKNIIGNNGIVCTVCNNEIRVYLSAGRLSSIKTHFPLKYILFDNAQYIAVLDSLNTLNIYNIYGQSIQCINNVQEFWALTIDKIIVKKLDSNHSIEGLIKSININKSNELIEYNKNGNIVQTLSYNNTFYINKKMNCIQTN